MAGKNPLKAKAAGSAKKLVWAQSSWDDYLEWREDDPKAAEKIEGFIKECFRTPFTGTGKPEALKHRLSGFWLRRIKGKDRFVYRVTSDSLEILSCKYHY